MYLLLTLLPLYSWIILSIFGRMIGKQGTIIITIIKNIILFILVHIITWEVLINKNTIIIELFPFIKTDIYNITWGLIYDVKSIIITYLIINIYICVITYSIWYMDEDPSFIRFFTKLNLFCFAMILLVQGINLIILFVGWELVGITSYLLINFWYTRLAANKSAIQAILYNKIGDIFFLIGLFLLFCNIRNIPYFENLYIIETTYDLSNYIIICFLIAVIAKSAQIGLHVWLPNAMEGPTPVSSLIHAATMVVSGIYLLYRILPYFQLSIIIMNVIAIISLFTIIFGGLSSLVQQDFKKLIAYSTCSQLGYMLFAISIGIINNSYNYLLIHGFFKALLFLCSGILIHLFYNNQDIRKFGGLIYYLPITYIFFFIGTISILSLPFYSGFYSKDIILEYSFFSYSFLYIIAILGVILTSCYSIKLFFNIFFYKPKMKYIHINEPFLSILLILIIGSLFLGYYLITIFNYNIINGLLTIIPFNSYDFEFLSKKWKLLPFVITIFSICIYLLSKNILYIYIKYNINLFYIYNFISNKFYIDYIYNYIFNFIYFKLFVWFTNIDKGILELFGYTGLYRIISTYKTNIKYNKDRLDNFIYLQYLFISIISIFIILYI